MIGASSTIRRRFVAAMAAGLIGVTGAVVGVALPAGVAHAAIGDCTPPAPLLKTGEVYQVSTEAQLRFIASRQPQGS